LAGVQRPDLLQHIGQRGGCEHDQRFALRLGRQRRLAQQQGDGDDARADVGQRSDHGNTSLPANAWIAAWAALLSYIARGDKR
jgi:hypothetical protein